MLNCDLELFPKSYTPSEQLLFFLALILNRDNKERESKYVKITIQNRFKQWLMKKFQSLVKFYVRCTQFESKSVRTQKSEP